MLKKYFEHTLSRARELAAEKKFDSALKIVSGVIALDPTPDIVSRARNLLEAIENARILSEVLEAEVETDADVYETGETVRISVRLYNRSLGAVVIPLMFKDKKTIFGTKKVPAPNRIRIKYIALDFMSAAWFDPFITPATSSMRKSGWSRANFGRSRST